MGFAFALGGGGLGEGGDVPADAHLFEDGVVADFAEPVGGVAVVGLVAMDDGVPVAAGRGMEALRNVVGFGPQAAAEQKASADGRGE